MSYLLVCYLLLISSVSSIRSVYLGLFYGTRGSIKFSHLTSKWYSVWAQRINALMNRWHAVRFRYGSCLSAASTRTDSSQSYISTVVVSLKHHYDPDFIMAAQLSLWHIHARWKCRNCPTATHSGAVSVFIVYHLFFNPRGSWIIPHHLCTTEWDHRLRRLHRRHTGCSSGHWTEGKNTILLRSCVCNVDNLEDLLTHLWALRGSW